MRARLLAGVVLGLGAWALPVAAASPQPSASSANGAEYVSGELLVRYRSGASATERAAIRKGEESRLVERLPIPGLELVRLESGRSVPAAASAYERNPEVLYAEPNYIYSAQAIPNDPRFGELWGMNNTGQTVNGGAGVADADIDAPEAWDITTGSASVTVAVVDSGVDYNHPDLTSNIWTNPGESGSGKETNALDDDSNGLIDDWRGWDWVPFPNDNDPMDPNGHGTHLAGTIGARGNNGIGVAGVNSQVQMMALRTFDANLSGTTANAAAAFLYAGGKGAQVVNASFNGSADSLTIRSAIAASPNTLFVAAAGNGGADLIGDNNETTPQYPCNIPAANLICVAATDQGDYLTSFSNYGSTSVDLAAPGTRILSTLPGNAYGFKGGTSMATPHVAGAAALVFAQNPGATPTSVRNALLGSVDQMACLQGKVAAGGRLNVFRALGGTPAATVCTPATSEPPLTPGPPPLPSTVTPAVNVTFPQPGSKLKRRKLTNLRGTVANATTVDRVSVSLKHKRGKRCRQLTRRGLRKRKCSKAVLLQAEDTTSWSYGLSKGQRATLRTGKYELHVQLFASDGAQVRAGGTQDMSFTLIR